MQFLDKINCHEDLLKVSRQDEDALCEEIRQFLVQKISKSGGHLASNLGIVELQVAIEKVFDTAKDRLVFDVGHQSYVHKILTGRRDQFDTLRQLGGLSGFPKPGESDCDAFVAGHASNAVSVALGMARARTLQKEDYHVLALMGDGAMTGGLAYEGMNDAGASGEPMIVILNDNGMSIKPNVGGIASHLNLIRTRPGYFRLKKLYRSFTRRIPGGMTLYRCSHWVKEKLKRHLVGTTVFEEMGFQYMGPVDGHDITRLIYMLRRAKEMERPVLLHVLTQKGRGYAPAEKNPDIFHGIGAFDPYTGSSEAAKKCSFSETFGDTLTQMAGRDPKICAITAAMEKGTGLSPFAAKYPDRFFDVGIAEGHAVCMAGGLAKQGMRPVVAIYSTFLQRAFDMLLQDIAMLGLHVVFAVDRAGLVGEDGETHHGAFDVGYLRQVPGMTVFCPANCAELRHMLHWALEEETGPVAIRFPRGGDGRYQEAAPKPVLRQGKDCTLVCYGTTVNLTLDAADLLLEQNIHASVVKLQTIKPLQLSPVLEQAKNGQPVFVIEETVSTGCVAQEIAACFMQTPGLGPVHAINFGDRFVSHGSVAQLHAQLELDGPSIAKSVREGLDSETKRTS